MYPKAEKKFEESWKRLEERLKKLGVTKGLIDRAKLFSKEYIEGYTEKYFAEASPEFREKAQELIIDDALRMAEKWITGITAVFAPEKAEKLLEAMHL